MKKLLIIPLLVFSVTAADYDLRKGLDLTGIVGGPTPTQLNQLVDAGLIATNKGLIFITPGNTNPTATPFGRSDMTNFVWRDTSNAPPVLRVWNAAAGTWDTASLAPGSVTTSILNDGAVTTPKLAASAVETAKIGDRQVTTAKIAIDGVWTTNILDAQVVSNKIGNRTIVATNIASGVITATELATNIIGSNYITLYSVTASNLQPYTITSNVLANNSVDGTKVVERSLGNTDIALGVLTSNEIAGASITLTNLETRLQSGFAFAWVRFNGAGTISGSNNVASVTRNSVGFYTLTFITNPTTTNYIINGNCQSVSGAGLFVSPTNIAPGSFQIATYTTTPTATDSSNVWISVFGGH